MKIAGAELLLDTINGIKNDSLKPNPQQDEAFSAAPKLTAKTGKINWDDSAHNIRNLVRGLSPAPGAYSFLESRKIIILKAKIESLTTKLEPGTITIADKKKGISVACGDRGLYIEKLKPQGKNKMNSAEFVRGYHIEVGNRFTE